MNATRHGTTNFKMIRPYLNGMGPDGDSHRRFTAEGFMDLVAEYLFYSDYKGRPVYSLTHYGRQNGDAMRDPDMTVSVDWSTGSVEPLTFQNDYLGVYQEVYKRDESGQLLYSEQTLTNSFGTGYTTLKNRAIKRKSNENIDFNPTHRRPCLCRRPRRHSLHDGDRNRRGL